MCIPQGLIAPISSPDRTTCILLESCTSLIFCSVTVSARHERSAVIIGAPKGAYEDAATDCLYAVGLRQEGNNLRILKLRDRQLATVPVCDAHAAGCTLLALSTGTTWRTSRCSLRTLLCSQRS